MMGCPQRHDSREEEEGEVQQFATAVPAFSSQYGGYKRGGASYKVGNNSIFLLKYQICVSGLLPYRSPHPLSTLR